MPDGRLMVAGSFRGVPFFVEDDARSGGRRLKIDEYPGRDDNTVQDLGRRVRTFPITVYTLGDNYLAERDALIEALEAAGPGELIHPYYRNTIRAHCQTYSAPNSRAVNGQALISITFVEAPVLVSSPIVLPQLEALTASLATLTVETVVDDLGESYDASGQPAFALESVSADVEAVAKSYREQIGPVITAAGPLQRSADVAIQELANLERKVAAIVSDATSLVQAPDLVIERFADVFESFQETAKVAAHAVFAALLVVYDTAPQPAAIGDTPTREQERANQAALGSAMRIQAIMLASALIVGVEYASVEDAEADRDALIQRIDEQVQTASDRVYSALINTRAAVARAVPGNQNLARETTSQQNTAIPATVLAYQLYGDANRDLEIMDRNPDQKHPGFLVGAIGVLSR